MAPPQPTPTNTKMPVQNSATLLERTSDGIIRVETVVADHDETAGGAHESDTREKHTTQQTHSFKVDHLKQFFEQEMYAQELERGQSMATTIRHSCAGLSEAEIDVPFYVVNVSHFARQYLRWNHYLGRIRPFYAIKSNPSEFIIRVLNKVGAGFDCASIQELDLVRDHCGAGFDFASRVIYAHPCKPISHIRRFRAVGVQMTVVDNTDELRKLKTHWPEAKVLIRLKPDDAHSLNPLSAKFGASEDECIDILHLGRELNTNLIGCTFHVGSRCYDAEVFNQSIQMARRVFDIARSKKFKFKFDVLDIGGGFMGLPSEAPALPEVASVINKSLETFFPKQEGVCVIAEPGRYFSSGGVTLVCRVIGRRIGTQSRRDQKSASSRCSFSALDDDSGTASRMKNEDIDGVCDHQPLPALVPLPASSWMAGSCLTGSRAILAKDKINIYYINDGIYGTFNAIVFDQKTFVTHYLRMSSQTEHDKDETVEKQEEQFQSVVFGPTCDSLDCIAHAIDLPLLDVNDILWFPDVGSYTAGSASNFNGFKTNKCVLYWNK